MKQIKVAVLSMMLLAAGTHLFAQADTKEQLVVPLSNPGKPYTLKLDLVNGSIKVTGYAGKEVVIDVSADTRSNRKERNADKEGMKRITGNHGYEVSAKENNNTVRIDAGNPSRIINFELKVPQDGTFKLSTVNSGNIEISNLKGEMEISNVNGYVKMSNVSGNVVANTVNGDVVVSFNSVEGKSPMAFSTLNGKVDVTFPASTKANLKLKSDMGEIFSDFDIDVDKSEPKRNKTSQGGFYKISVDSWVYGKINGGGPEVMMKNMNGSIFIRKSK